MLRAVLRLGQMDCIPAYEATNSQPCRGAILLLEEEISA